jgi:hypothetical protein
LQRFVRTQVLGRSLDALLSLPPSGVPDDRAGGYGAGASEEVTQAARMTRNQIEALAPAVLLSLASTMADVRVGVWVMRALQPCVAQPSAECALIAAIPPDLRFPCLSICSAFDTTGDCWRLMLGQLRYADSDPAYHAALMGALARAPTEELLNATMALTLNSTVVRAQDAGSMIAMLASNPLLPRARHIVWEFAKVRLSLPPPPEANSHPFSPSFPPPPL